MSSRNPFRSSPFASSSASASASSSRASTLSPRPSSSKASVKGAKKEKVNGKSKVKPSGSVDASSIAKKRKQSQSRTSSVKSTVSIKQEDGDSKPSMMELDEAMKDCQTEDKAEEEVHRTTLTDLPVELMYEIHRLSHSSSLPYINREFHFYLSKPEPFRAAQWLFDLYAVPWLAKRLIQDDDEWFDLTRVLRHPICTLQVLKAFETLWRESADVRTVAETGRVEQKKAHRRVVELGEEPGKQLPWIKTTEDGSVELLSLMGMKAVEAPRWIFRVKAPEESHTVPPLLEYLFKEYNPWHSSHNGYGLQRAVLAGNEDLVKFLLYHGADPGKKDGLALEIAISKKNLNMIKLLVDKTTRPSRTMIIERELNKGKAADDAMAELGVREWEVDVDNWEGEKGDRLKITPGIMQKVMASGDKAIIDYFVKERGHMPSLGSLLAWQ